MSDLKQVTHIDNVRLGDDGTSVIIIDQTLLPGRTEYLTLRTLVSVPVSESMFWRAASRQRIMMSFTGSFVSISSTSTPHGRPPSI